MIVALLSASFSLVVGVLAGAALQRWGDADRATEHHTRYTRDAARTEGPPDEFAAPGRSSLLYEPNERMLAVYVRDWGPLH